ncbi:MAG: cysteine--tRNA ligase, partial [Epsilonproteobacteria bacterium]|nr:cysteine--tRNA ligase [Campylobacterota bacterium]
MHIFDSHLKKKVKLEPIVPGKISMYVCGPTVYDDAHLGHARSSIVFDLLRRVLKELEYDVTFVKNFTDIDDKIINKMNQSGQSLLEITTHYIKRYKEDMRALNVLDADIEPKATETLDEIVEMVSTLLEKGYAYKLEDGIYFDTTKDKEYLSLTHKDFDEEVQNRVECHFGKKDQKDFALWKFPKANEPSYDAPFGEGRPGWHIECSCMIKKHIANDGEYQIDIHGGGADLFFPHHENEAAQTRCATDQTLSKYWMHNSFVNINGEKMSKSLGNSFFIKDALKAYDGEILRFYLLSTHYRSNFNFNEIDLLDSKKRLDKIYRLKKRVYDKKASTPQKEFKSELMEALSDDLNISKALSVIDKMTSAANDKLDKNPKDKVFQKEIVANLELISKVLGVGLMDAYEYFQLGISKEEKEKIETLLKQRDEAKKAKDYQKADKIRDELLSMDIKIMDTPKGTVWEK